MTPTGAGQTIAIVDAYDDPTIATDLQTFDAQFGLPNPTFTKVNQTGGTQYPPTDPNWVIEIALDVEWAHAMAPGANILLVEANSDQLSDLLTAVNYASSQPGVSVVSMSWGCSEFAQETQLDSYFTTPAGHQGVTFVAATGDNAAPASWPATSPNVVAVGGTSLKTLDSDGNVSRGNRLERQRRRPQCVRGRAELSIARPEHLATHHARRVLQRRSEHWLLCLQHERRRQLEGLAGGRRHQRLHPAMGRDSRPRRPGAGGPRARYPPGGASRSVSTAGRPTSTTSPAETTAITPAPATTWSPAWALRSQIASLQT